MFKLTGYLPFILWEDHPLEGECLLLWQRNLKDLTGNWFIMGLL